MAEFAWNKQRLEAAQMVSEDKLTDEEISKQLGIARQTLGNWKRFPEFMAKVQEHIDAYEALVRRRGIARLANRVDALNNRWELMQRVVLERAASDQMKDVPGGPTGLLVHTVKGVGRGDDFQLIDLYEVDTGLLNEIRQHEKQAAQELGQWTEKKEVSGHDGGPVQVNATVTQAATEELQAWRRQMNMQLGSNMEGTPGDSPPMAGTTNPDLLPSPDPLPAPDDPSSS